MKTPIIRIGNSRGIRIPKALLIKYEISDNVDLVMEKDCIVLRPIVKPRQSWDESFQQMNFNGEDELLIDDVFQDESIGE